MWLVFWNYMTLSIPPIARISTNHLKAPYVSFLCWQVSIMKHKKNDQAFNPKNERAKHRYKSHVEQAEGKDPKTLWDILKHIRYFEEFTGFKGFEAFNKEQAVSYVKHLQAQNLSLSFNVNNLRSIKVFLQWLERQQGYRSKINPNHIDYLNVSKNQKNMAKAQAYQKSYTFDDIVATIQKMPHDSDTEKRDRAMIALQALCTLRISELRTVKIRNLITEQGRHFIHVCPKDMDVKFAKPRMAYFLPLPDAIVHAVLSWRDLLLSRGFKEGDPLFPKIDVRFRQDSLLETSVSKQGIKSNTTLRDLFKRTFVGAGLPYIRPHSFRKTLVRYAQHQSPAFLNAVRQNLGHTSIDTTLSSYGHLSHFDQGEIISYSKIDLSPPRR